MLNRTVTMLMNRYIRVSVLPFNQPVLWLGKPPRLKLQVVVAVKKFCQTLFNFSLRTAYMHNLLKIPAR